MAKKIVLYFGSFNPIHNGHTQLAKHIIEKSIADELWFVVSPRNPLKSPDDLLDEYLRLDMVVLAIKNKQGIKASDIEFTMPIPSYTFDTLEQLSINFPENEFSIMIGSDNVYSFSKWKNYNKILEKYKVFVYPRNGYDFAEFSKTYPQMTLLKFPCIDISSTQIRNAIQENKSFSQWVNPDVEHFIIENELFK